MEITENNTISTLSHELVSLQEQNIGTFFAAYSIQALLTKKLLKQELNFPTFIKHFSDLELYGEQRIFIKKLIIDKTVKEIFKYLNTIILEYNQDQTIYPHEIFLKQINKSFLIRQIFKQTEQILDKYHFIEHFLNKKNAELDFDDLILQMKDFTIQEKTLVIIRIFINLKDDGEENKKQIFSSFIQNIKRTKSELQLQGYDNTIEIKNLNMLLVGMNN
jgi:hypothetical protein